MAYPRRARPSFAELTEAAAFPVDAATTIEEFIDSYRYGNPVKTVLFYQDQVGRALARFLQGASLDDLTLVEPRHIVQFLNQERARLSPASLGQRYGAAHRFFAWCVEQGYLRSSPMDRMRRPKLPDDGRTAFTRAEVQRMAQVLRAKPGIVGIRDRALFTLLLGAGPRAAEVVAMRVRQDHLDWAHHRIWLYGKGGKRRAVRMGAKLAAALKPWLRAREAWQPTGDELWWTQMRTPLSYASLESFAKRLGEYAGVEDCHLHRFRHTFATELYRQHRDILMVKAALGHSNVEITMRYLRSLGIEYGEDANYASPDEWLL